MMQLWILVIENLYNKVSISRGNYFAQYVHSKNNKNYKFGFIDTILFQESGKVETEKDWEREERERESEWAKVFIYQWSMNNRNNV